MDRALTDRGIGLVDAIALDIGVSSMQLDRADRGFSFQADGPLDMRMSRSGLTAAEFLNSAEEAALARVLGDFGEGPRARASASARVDLPAPLGPASTSAWPFTATPAACTL